MPATIRVRNAISWLNAQDYQGFEQPTDPSPQKNILETCISYYIDIDIFFSLAEEKYSAQRIKNLGGNVRKVVPVGSFFLEHDWYRKKKDQEFKNDLRKLEEILKKPQISQSFRFFANVP